jgi:hypothetical protein
LAEKRNASKCLILNDLVRLAGIEPTALGFGGASEAKHIYPHGKFLNHIVM